MESCKKMQIKRKLAFLMAVLLLIVGMPHVDFQTMRVSAEELQEEENTPQLRTGNTGDVTGNEGQSDVSGNQGSESENGITVTIEKSAGGTISLADGSEVQETLTVSAGDTITLLFQPEDGKRLASLQVDEEGKNPSDCIGLTDQTGNYNGGWQYELADIAQDMTVSATFEEIEEVTLSCEDAGLEILNMDELELPKYENTYYAKAAEVKIKASGDKLIRLLDGTGYGAEINLQIDDSQLLTMSSLYWCAKNPESFGTEQKLLLDTAVMVIWDEEKPELALEQSDFWVAKDCESFEISGSVTDVALERVVWFAEEQSEDEVKEETEQVLSVGEGGIFQHTFTLDVAQATEDFYLYAVDKAGEISEPGELIVYKDGAAPEITEAVLEGPNQKPFGNFGKDDAKLTVTVQDTVSGNDSNTSGIERVEVYAGDDTTQTYEARVSGSSPDTGKQTVIVTIPAEQIEAFSVLKELKMKAVDRVGNASEEYVLTDFGVSSNDLLLEVDKPVINVKLSEAAVYKNGTEYWYREIPSFDYSAKDNGSGLAKRWIMLNGKELTAHHQDGAAALLQVESGTISSGDLQEMQAGENTICVLYEDNAGNKGEVEQKLYLDTHQPCITEFSITHKTSTLSNLLRLLSFGNYYNSQVLVTVTADDTLDVSGNNVASAGLDKITLYLDGVAYETLPVTAENQVTFTIPGEEILEGTGKVYLNCEVSASVTDKVGNSSERNRMTTENSDMESSNLMIETVLPRISIVPDKEMYVSEDGTIYNNAHTSFSVKALDMDSGLGETIIKINGTTLVNQTYAEQMIKEDIYTVSTESVSEGENGYYELEIKVVDNAGNVVSDVRKLYKDQTVPAIIKVDMVAAGTVEADGTALTYTEQNYGYYFHENTRVTIYATDGKETGGAGVEEIQYYLVDYTGEEQKKTTVKVDKEEKISFVIPAQFKGQIYARAYDKVQNVPETYVTPSGMIIETPEQHAREEHIFLQKDDAPYTDSKGGELYAEEVSVTIGIVDTFSGIRSVEWSVDAPHDTEANQQGALELDNSGNFMEGSDAGWTKTQSEKNLVTKLEKKITVTNNSNDIALKVSMTDRAGNSSEHTIIFSIDMTQPEIQISFDVTETQGGYEQIFNQDRVATITVKERNFNEENIEAAITNTDGTIPEISDWSTEESAENPDETTSTATITFSADGDYTLEVNGRDGANNQAESVKIEDFTIDQTVPIITVHYSSDEALNGNYYASARAATVQIEEHNFTDEQVIIKGTATDNGVAIAFPQAGDFGSNGDVHTTIINCAVDGLYRFDVEYTDMAGNVAEVYVGEAYYVDLIAPKIEISGVEHMSANNGEVVPQILLTDTNYDSNGVDIKLTGANLGKVEPSGEYTKVNLGQSFVFSDFAREKENDDIYTLTVTLTDKAGNESTETITFSVNRFGSVYVLDESLKKIAGTYIQEEIDVKLSEINVDNLEHDKIKVVIDANGSTRNLREGSDYTVEESGGNGSWYQYDYTIDKSLFAGDGRYIITLYSVDAAGNINENVDESKKAEISFGVDKTAPMVIPIDIESDTQYPVDVKTATVAVNDNLVLEDVEIYIGGEKCEYSAEGENYTFDIPSATVRQDVTVAARDAAGNRTNYVISKVLVTTNAFIRWYNNKPLFVGSLAGMAVVSGSSAGLFVTLRRRRIKIRK